MRQFNSEGFVNRFVLDTVASDSATYIFNSEAIENLPEGFRARLVYTIQNENEFTEKFEIAAPKGKFKLYLQNYWTRIEIQ